MRASLLSSSVGVFCLVLLASCGGNPPGETGEGAADTGDVTDVVGGDTTDADGAGDGEGSGGSDGSDGSADGSATGPRLPVGELCLGDDACESSLCFRFDPNIEEGFCTQFCSEESDCPAEGGFSCVLLANSGGDFARVCVPDNLCVDRDEDGYGVGPGCAGPDCDDSSAQVNPAQDELCDAVDNDCDSNIDENPVDANVDCDTGFPGLCSTGRARCNSGTVTCEADRGAQPEICDTLDNDCDGAVDESADGGPLQEACYGGSAATRDVGACRAGVRSCEEGLVGDCVGQVLPQLEVCDGVDNDCDGEVDEGSPGADQPCDVPGAFGVCARGRTQCDEAGELICNPLATGTDELCDGQDNDCDGATDEGADGAALKRICYGGADSEIGVGVCTTGFETCVGSEYGDCVGDVLPGPELCDTLDNDCDGEVDEGAASGGFVCATGLPGACAVGTTICGSDGTVCIPNEEPTDEVCDAVDNDCDGAIDEDEAGLRLRRACYSGPVGTQGVGLCTGGFQTCGGDGFGVCVDEVRPDVEVCDGLDNDCDGLIDEGNPGGNVVCNTGEPGVCSVGVTACEDARLVCAGSTEPSIETCDGTDNDCDGFTDEDEGGAALRQSCYDGPAGSSGVGACTAGVRTCSGATFGSCVGQVLPGVEVCDDVDNDCDGAVNENNPGGNVVCSTGAVGVCAVGLTLCSDGEIECVQSTASATETCDRLDNDCDGLTDEDASGAPLSATCYGGPAGTLGVGICAAGVQTCTSGAPGACVGDIRPGTEVCDGLDNDCDGLVDEGNPGGNVVCGTGNAGVCAVGLTSCVDGESVCIQTSPPTEETCDGVDNDCDGLSDEDEAGAPLRQSCYDGPAGTSGAGACRAGVRTCTAASFGSCVGQVLPSAELCDAVDNDCDGSLNEGNPGGNVVCSTGAAGVCAAGVTLCSGGAIECVQSTASSAETCDGRDNDCDGLTDENASGAALSNSCYGGPAGTQGVGLCAAGVQTCTGGAPGACVGEVRPATEVCDGLDNDCDGLVDEGNPEGNVVCSTGAAGVCSAGVTACIDGDVECVQSTASSAETCDGRDNDCDGLTDENASGAALSNSCYGGPAGTQGVGLCAAGVQTCTGGAPGACVGEVRPAAEVCDGRDNDCDGLVDEGNPEGNVVCSTGGVGVCSAGITACTAGAVVCVQTTTASAETCDGRDNDCDGLTDEDASGAALTQTCYDGPAGTAGVGACSAGVRTCTGSGFGSCVGQALPSTEVCDLVDNDCDGAVNEGNPGGGITCTTGSSGVCAAGVTSCVAGSVTCVGTIAPGSQTEICDTVDNDCDGSTNEGFPGLGNTCTTGEGICARPGVIVCASNTAAAPVCSAVAGTPNPSETCDYVDDDCDGTVDEGFRNGSGAYNTVAHCGACGFDCNSTWPGGPALFNVATQCNASGTSATCGFTCLAGWVNADGVADNGCEFRPEPETVYVSTFANGGRDVAGCGVYTAPCASIQGGIDLARTTAGKTRVRVSTGLYRENIVLANGISVLGGHSNLNWVRNAEVFGTSIRGADVASSIGGANDRIVVTADGITSVTEFSGFIVSGVNGGVGGNSVGVFVRNSNANLRIQNNEISAGAGGSGTTGAAGTPGQTGVAGGNGGTAKRANDGAAEVAGGTGGARSCGGSAVNGGRGGNGEDPIAVVSGGSVVPSPNGPGVNGQGSAPGTGGSAGFDMLGDGSCFVSGVIAGSPGSAGANGSDGAGGTGATNANGSLSGILWRAASGANGAAGASGSGGGGGGAPGGVDEFTTSANLFPPGGGGGGSGGCAGASGVGGGGGGASFAVYVVFSGSTPASTSDMPTISSNRLRRGAGGKGGDGGTGGGGGEGGAAGSGGAILTGDAYSFCLVPGSPGGVGGRGGHAGGGGGGAGGVSYDIWVSRPGSVSPTYSTANTFDVAAATVTGGSGGSGGNSSNTSIGIGGNGVTGSSGQVRIGN